MGTVYITLKIMPESPDTELGAIESKAGDFIKENEGNLGKVEQQPVAFGLKSLNMTFSMNEDKGGTDELEEKISSIEGVQSVQVTDVRRAIG